METSLESRLWWDYIHEDLKELIVQSKVLVKTVKDWEEHSGNFKFHDYAFIVFPAAKAYEGFLKTVFHDLGFMTDEEFFGKRFRVGKALNPALDKRFRKRLSVYDKLVDFCRGKELPDRMWSTWKKGRNLLFHWFPDEKNAVTFTEAEEIIDDILETMDFVFRGCKLK